jgi:transposase
MTVPHWNALTDIQSVGLDVCKSSIRVCILTKGQTLDYEIKNDSQEIKKFCKSCCIPQMKNVPFIIESTGDYHIGMTLELKKCDMNVKEINPIITKQYTRSSIRGTKTDKTDAVVLAKIGVIE